MQPGFVFYILVLVAGSGELRARGLLPANAGGNPSFQIGIAFGNGRTGRPTVQSINHTCQATLVAHRREGDHWHCTLVTAAHCILVAGFSDPVTIFAADFGAIRHPTILVKAWDLHAYNDLAVVHFVTGCPEDAHDLVVELGELPASSRDGGGTPITIYVASATFSRLFTGVLPDAYAPEKGVLEVALGSGPIGGNEETFSTYGGDSGGGLFVRENGGRSYRLIGVISQGQYLINERHHRGEDIPDWMGADRTVFATDLEWIRSQVNGSRYRDRPRRPAD